MKVGIGTRVINFIVDTTLIGAITYGISVWWDFHVVYWNYTFIPVYSFFAAITFIYYVLFEGIFARTPGKWLSISKVVKLNSAAKPNIIQVIIRTLVRLTIIDCFFIPFLNKTLHDYISKTEVIEA